MSYSQGIHSLCERDEKSKNQRHWETWMPSGLQGAQSSVGEDWPRVHNVGPGISVGLCQVPAEVHEAYRVGIAYPEITVLVSSSCGSHDRSTASLLECSRPVILGDICSITSLMCHILGDMGQQCRQTWNTYRPSKSLFS